ncbi:hypothetical protein Ccrd_008973 [Cynara cardunculus var. scolymus]|uniref:Cyanobacterial aminoacyl-tRNA synthetase CAAD domain-containing protein n=1 Tax=Cynara cardunculus var. scolymus TaxID=59895 RepID=A0A103XE71_CYNCS|nr:hypothetical protein Ccrd_008973 [Cynara cardunculus var. scolymus]
MATTVYAAATSTSMAATAVMLPRLPTRTTTTARCSAVPNLPTRSFSTSVKQVSESKRSSLFRIKASEDASSATDPNELFTDLLEKWDALENKSTVIIYGGGGIVAIWLSSILIASENNGVGRTWIYGMVCLPISTLQVEQKRASHGYRVHKEEDRRDRVDDRGFDL